MEQQFAVCVSINSPRDSMGNSKEIKYIDGRFATKASALLYFDIRTGTIQKIEGIENVLGLTGVVGYHLCHNPGDTILGYGTTDNVAMRFILVCDSWRELKELIYTIQSEIKIIDTKGNSMVVDPFNPEKLPDIPLVSV